MARMNHHRRDLSMPKVVIAGLDPAIHRERRLLIGPLARTMDTRVPATHGFAGLFSIGPA
jgi:hypothetical protein